MLQAWILKAALFYLLEKLLEYAKGVIPWDQIKAEGSELIRAFIPGKVFDEDAVGLFTTVLAGCERILQAEANLKAITELLLAGKRNEAAQLLKDLILGSWNPDTEKGKEFVALLAAKPGLFSV